MSRNTNVNNIDLDFPCKEPWENMPGNEKKRHCGACNKDVYNLSEFTKRAGDRLIRKRNGRICVRFAKTSDGHVITKPPVLHQIIGKSPAIATGALVTSLTLTAPSYAQGQPSPANQSKSAAQVEVQNDTLRIRVVDPVGDSLPGATAEIRNGQFVRTQSTDEVGETKFGNIPFGEFEYIITAAGFKTSKGSILVQTNTSPVLKIQLALGEIGVVVGGISGTEYEDPLLLAISNGDQEDVEMMVKAGFDMFSIRENSTPLGVAMDSAEWGIANLLIKKGAGVHSRGIDEESTIIKLASRFGEKDKAVIGFLRVLISHGANLDDTDSDGDTPLHLAANYDDALAVQILLEAGADPEINNKNGKTAFDLATEIDVVEEFKKHGITD